MSGFDDVPGKYALTATKAEYWMKAAREVDVFEVLGELLPSYGFVVEPHPRTPAAILISGGECLKSECEGELYEILRNSHNVLVGKPLIVGRHNRKCDRVQMWRSNPGGKW